MIRLDKNKIKAYLCSVYKRHTLNVKTQVESNKMKKTYLAGGKRKEVGVAKLKSDK